MNKQKQIHIYLPESYIRALDHLVNEKYYPNRSEVVRLAVRDLIKVEVWDPFFGVKPHEKKRPM